MVPILYFQLLHHPAVAMVVVVMTQEQGREEAVVLEVAVVMLRLVPPVELEPLIKVLPVEHRQYPHLLRVVVVALERLVKTVKQFPLLLEMAALVLLQLLRVHLYPVLVAVVVAVPLTRPLALVVQAVAVQAVLIL